VIDIPSLIISGGSSVLLSGVLVYLLRNWISVRLKASIQNEYDEKLKTLEARLRIETEKDIERYKAQLKYESELEIMKLRSDLEIAAAEKNLRFSHVFPDTAQTIRETYGKLVDLKDAVLRRMAVGSENQAEIERDEANLRQKREAAWDYLDRNKIVIPKPASGMAKEVLNELSELERKYGEALRLQRVPQDTQALAQKRGDELSATMRNVGNLLSTLEDSFQEIFGFPIQKKDDKK